VINEKTKEFVEKTVRDYCGPDTINLVLKTFEEKALETEGEKKLVCEAWAEGIKKALGRVL